MTWWSQPSVGWNVWFVPSWCHVHWGWVKLGVHFRIDSLSLDEWHMPNIKWWEVLRCDVTKDDSKSVKLAVFSRPRFLRLTAKVTFAWSPDSLSHADAINYYTTEIGSYNTFVGDLAKAQTKTYGWADVGLSLASIGLEYFRHQICSVSTLSSLRPYSYIKP